jgi:hypothetical protein
LANRAYCGATDSLRFSLAVVVASLALAPAASAAVLHDQYNPATTPPMHSMSSNDTLAIQSMTADDFEVPSGATWSVDRVDANGVGTATSFNIFFFTNAGQLPQEPAPAIYSRGPIAIGATTTDLSVPLDPPVSLPAGRYWVAVQGTGPLATTWNWATRTAVSGNPAAFKNNIMASPCPSFVTRSGGCGNATGNPDQAFRLQGTGPVPGGTVLGSPTAPGGTVPGAPTAPGRDGTAPSFTGKSPSASPNPFAVNLAGKAETNVKGSARKRKAVQKGTTFRYSLSEAATVTFTIQRKRKGRKVGKKCKKRTPDNRKRRKCTRYSRVGAFRQQASTGANRKPFSGKIGKKTLRPGRYRALLVATDAAGNRSKAKAVGFRVVRAGKR